MANYYTYGKIPNVEETVYGPLYQGYADGGEAYEPVSFSRGLPEEEPVGPSPLSLAEDEPVPADQPLPDEPYYSPSEEYNEPATLPSRRQDTQPTPPPLTSPTSSGDTVPTYIPPGLEAALLRMRGESPEQLAAKAQATAQTKPQREVLSDLLKAGQFDAAFKYAKDNGVQNLLIDPTELRTLRGPFSNDEMQSFFAAMPKDLMGEQDERAVKFTPDKALDQSLKVASIPREGIAAGPLGDIIGYPDVQRAFEPQQLVKEPNAFDKLIKAAVYGGLAFAGATALAGAGGIGKAIVQLPETIGIKVGEALGANTLSTLQAKMIGNAVISGGVTGAKGGDLEDILKSAALAAGFTYVSDKAIKTIAEGLQKTGVTDAVKNIPGGDVTAVDPSAAADIASKVSQGIDQFTVTFTPSAAAAQLAGTVGALSAAQVATPTDEPEVKVTAEAEKPVETPPVVTGPVDTAFEPAPTVGDKQQVTVEAPATKPVETPPVVVPSPIDTAFEPAPTVGDKQQVTVEAPANKPVETPPVVVPGPVDTAFEPAPTVGDKQQVTVETPANKPVETPPVVVTGPVDTAFEPAPTVGDKQEIKVETPATKPVETPPVVVTGPVDTAFEPAPTVDDKQEIKVETPADKPVETPPVVTPPPAKTEPPPEEEKPEEKKKEEEDPLKALLDKYGTLENLLKLIGIIGSVTSKPPKAPAVTPTAPSTGGALPKYTYTRTALSPDIDYYTYGTRPEAKFFEQGFQLEKPTQPGGPQPEVPPAGPQPEGPPASPLNNPAVVNSQQTVYAPATSENVVPRIAEEDPEYYRRALEAVQQPVSALAAPEDIAPRIAEEDPEYYRRALEAVQQMESATKAMGGLTRYSKGGSNQSRYFNGPGSGRDDKIPALLSDGEYVMDAETLALLGDGSTKEGARRMDEFRAKIRQHKGRALSRGQISPDAKSPTEYMGGGLA